MEIRARLLRNAVIDGELHSAGEILTLPEEKTIGIEQLFEKLDELPKNIPKKSTEKNNHLNKEKEE